MGNEHFVDETPWLLPYRRRRLRIGDMMAAVVVTAVGLAAVSLPGLAGGARCFIGAFALLYVGLQWAQWGLASIRTSEPLITLLLGAVSSITAISMIIGLVGLSLVFPQVAALFSVMLLVLVLHQATWG
jgi:hypothetical protein